MLSLDLLDKYLLHLVQTFLDPRVAQSFIRSHAESRIPSQTTPYEIDECGVCSFQCVAQSLGIWVALFAATISDYARGFGGVEEEFLASADYQHIIRRQPQHLHNAENLLVFAFPWKERRAHIEFGHDAP
jgi:hypothetical protein